MRRNNVFVPVRVVSEILGAEVSWENSRINIKYGETNLDLTIDDRTAYKNGQKLTLPAAPYERGGYTYVPIRFVGEAFDCDVEWQAKKNLVNIKTKPLELTGQPVLTVASRVRMTVDIFTYEVQSPFFAAQLYNILTYGCGNEVAEPEYYGDLVNMDPPNYYYQIGNYYFLTDNDRVVAHFEVYDVLHNGYGLPLPENYTEYLLYTDGKWYTFSTEAEKQFESWWGQSNASQVFAGENGYKAYAALVDGKNLNYATCYSRVGMGRTLDCYVDKDNVEDIYQCLQNGRTQEVSEPRTPYGNLFEVQDYYIEQFVLGFSEAEPQYERGSGGNATNLDFTFTVYAMLEGEPEFGEDSRYLLYDAQTDKWYAWPAEYFDMLKGALEYYPHDTLDYL